MRKYQKTFVAVLVVIGIAFAGIVFADQTGNTDAPAFGFLPHTENEACNTDSCRFGPPPMAGDQTGHTDRPAFGPPPSFFDVDRDGLVSQDEFPGPDNHFDQLDLNKDGFINHDEVPAEGPPIGPCPMAGDQAGNTDFPGFGPPLPPNSGMPSCGEPSSGNQQGFRPPPPFDTNNDGLVSQDEFPGPNAHFNALDLNEDGFINQDEAPERPLP